MKAIVATDRAAGTAGMKLVERPEPQGASLASLSGLLNRGLCEPGTIGNYLEPHPIEVNCQM